MTYAPLKHLHTKFRVIFSPSKQEYSRIFFKTTVNSSKRRPEDRLDPTSARPSPSSDIPTKTRRSAAHRLRAWKEETVVVPLCPAETRGVHRCWQLPPRGSDEAVFFSPFRFCLFSICIFFYLFIFFYSSSGATSGGGR